MTAEEWDDWDTNVRKNYPIRYFLTEILPIEFRVFKRRIDDIKWWMLYRTTHRYHVVRTGLRPGYYDCDNTILNINFNILTSYVEIETASKSISMSYSDRKTLYPMPWYWLDNHRKRTKLHPEAGLANLKWEMKLPPEESPLAQVNVATEIWILYHWWRHVRPNRPDSHEISGLDDWYKQHKPRIGGKSVMYHLSDKGIDPEEIAIRYKLFEIAREIEERYNQEDDDMLCRLMRIRRGLWV